MKHPLTLAIAFFILTCLFSCNQQHPGFSSKQEIPFHYNNHSGLEVDAAIYLTNDQGNFGTADSTKGKTFIRTASNNRSVLDVADSLSLGKDVVLNLQSKMNLHTFKPDTIYEKLFGANIDFNLFDDGVISNDSALYLPEIITLQVEEYPLKLKEGYPIVWNTDANNREGVYIVVEYSPYFNDKLSTRYSESIVNYVLVPDNGTAILSQHNFPDIPLGATVLLSIIRGAGGLAAVETAAGKSFLKLIAKSETSGFANFFSTKSDN